MCLVALALGTTLAGRYSFILAANRDEYYARPTAAAAWWSITETVQQPDTFSGKDLQAGGTWLAVNRAGRFAVVTNWRSAKPPAAAVSSRGHWPILALAEQNELALEAAMSQSGPGNLIYGDVCSPSSFCYAAQITNEQGQACNITHRPISIGIHGLSNGLLNADWPKTARLKQDLQQAIDDCVAQRSQFGSDVAEQNLIEQLFRALRRPDSYPPALLPTTGVSLASEQFLSSAWIESETYGTRVSTLLLAQVDGRCLFVERSRDGATSKAEFTAQSASSQRR
jgi:uncharacterized protein with NRDE domain